MKSRHIAWVAAGAIGCVGLCVCVAIAAGVFFVVASREQLPTSSGELPQPTAFPTSSLGPGSAAVSGTVITGAVMARDTRGNNYEPVGITDSFPADQKVFHVVVTITNAPGDTRFKVIWLTGASEEMGEYEITSEGSRNLDFTYEPDGGTLPVGNYQLVIFQNGILNRTLKFSVR